MVYFSLQGVMVGFKGELIHTFNKNENAIHKSTYFQDIGVSSAIQIIPLYMWVVKGIKSVPSVCLCLSVV